MKLTKNELRVQQTRLTQLQRYLPTLQLKKALLYFEVSLVQAEIGQLNDSFREARTKVAAFGPLLKEKVDVNLWALADVQHVRKHYENVAGVEIPVFDGVIFRKTEYSLFDTPAWTEVAVEELQALVVIREQTLVSEEKKRALERELREVSIRVNLFEKILIPRALQNISKIRIFLGDQQLAAIAQAKVAKAKMAARARSS